MDGRQPVFERGPAAGTTQIDEENDDDCRVTCDRRRSELACEANLLSLIPGAVTVTTALKAVGAEAEVGIGGSISLGFCPGTSGGVVAYSAQGCLSGFVRIGYGL